MSLGGQGMNALRRLAARAAVALVMAACPAVWSSDAAAAPDVRLVPQFERASVLGATVSHDGRYSIRWEQNGRVLTLWDHRTGLFLGEVTPPERVGRTSAISPTGRYLAHAAEGRVVIQDLDTGELRDVGPVPHRISALKFSRDGSRLFVAHADGCDEDASDHAVSAFDFATGEKLSEVASPLERGCLGPQGLVVGAEPQRLWWTRRDELVAFDMDRGRVDERVAMPEPGSSRLAISRDGGRAVTASVHVREEDPSGGFAEAEGVLRYWDLRRNAVLAETSLFGPAPMGARPVSDELAISPDGEHVLVRVVGGRDQGVRMFRFGQTEPAHDLGEGGKALAFTADARRAIVGVRVLDVDSGDPVHPPLVEKGDFDAELAMHGGRAYVVQGGVLAAWDLTAAELAWQRELDNEEARRVVVSPGGEHIVVRAKAGRNMVTHHDGEVVTTTPHEMIVIDREGELVRREQLDHGARIAFDDDGAIRRVALDADELDLEARRVSPDGRRIVGLPDPDRPVAEVRSLQSGEREQQVQLPSSSFPRLGWTANGVFATAGGKLRLWRLGEEQPLATHTLDPEGLGGRARPSPDGRTLLALGGSELRMIDTGNGEVLGSWSTNDFGYPMDMAIDDDRERAVLLVDAIPVALNLRNGRWVQLIHAGPQWVIAGGDGIFTASRDGGALLAAVRGRRGFRIDQLALRNNDPARILRRLDAGSERERAYYEEAFERRLRGAGVEADTLEDVFDSAPEAIISSSSQSGDQVELTIELTAERGLLSYNLDVNGVPLFGNRGKSVSGKSATLHETIELAAGDNRVEVRALDTAGVESLRPVRTFEADAEVDRDLFFVGFGVSLHANADFNLSYAHKDVQDLKAVLEHARGPFESVHTRTFVDSQVTPEALRGAKSLLADSKVDDVVILMVAGHGVYSRDDAARYYYVTHDTDPARLERTAVPFEDIEELLDGIGARNKLLLLDTCASGERDPEDSTKVAAAAGGRGLQPRTTRGLVVDDGPSSERRFLFEDDRFIANDLRRRTGAVVLSSSQGVELSYETKRVRNGVFTEALIKALVTDAADEDGDGRIDMHELRTFARQDVSRATGGRQNPTVDRDNIYATFSLPVVPQARGVLDRESAPHAPAETSQDVPEARPSPRGCGCRSAAGSPRSWPFVLALLWVLRRTRSR